MKEQHGDGRLSDLRLLWLQIRYQNTTFWRTPIAAFFTIAFPLMFLIVFTLVFPNEEIAGLGVTTAQFYAPSLAVFAAVSATFTNLATGTAIARDDGILKRVRGTPLPPWIYIAGRIGSACYLAVLSAGIMLAFGTVFYGVSFFAASFPAMVVTFLVGIACWAALGMLVAAVAPSGDSTPAITNATLLPLAFISGVFIPPSADAPAWLDTVSSIFPLKHFASAFGDAFNPVVVAENGSWINQFDWAALAVMAAWGIAAMFLALRWFRWEPQPGKTRRSRRKAPADPAAL